MGSLKQIFKKALNILVNCFPERYWLNARDRCMFSQRKTGRAYSYIERLINDLNRGLIIDKCLKNGIPYFARNHNIARRHIYEYIFGRYTKEPVDYLEFGVADGGSIRVALAKLSPVCKLYGFDSFEGLPEDWFREFSKNTFDRGGYYQISMHPI